MVESTQPDLAVSSDHRSPSLAAFDRLRIESGEMKRHNASDAARVAAAILADARTIRSETAELPGSGEDAGLHHRLHERLHAAERSALAAQRNGVEALTARLRDDHEGFNEISAAAFGALETSATALREAELLVDELGQPDVPVVPDAVDLSSDDVVIDLTGPVATVDVASGDQIEDAALVFSDDTSILGSRATIIGALSDDPLVEGASVRLAASGRTEIQSDSEVSAGSTDEIVVEATRAQASTVKPEQHHPEAELTIEAESDSLGFVVEPPPRTDDVSISLIDELAADDPLGEHTPPARKSPEEISAEAQVLISLMQPDTSKQASRSWISRLLHRNQDVRKRQRTVSRTDQKRRRARRKAEFRFERDLIKDSQRELKDSGVNLMHRAAWIEQLAYSVGVGILVGLFLVGLFLIITAG